MSPTPPAARPPPSSALHARLPSSPSSGSTTSLNHVLIAEAVLKSDDLGATLDFGHKSLTDVGEYGAEELAAIGRESSAEDESSVLRINLGSNKLATLPMAFALLSSLRYLNLRNNSFSVFPEVLTVMTSLEILDVGRNKIKRLPSQPGSLLNLRVFSFYKNKLTRLPPWFTQCARLEVLRCEQNPLEWPPKSMVDGQSSNMPEFIRTVQQWMTNNPNTIGRKFSEDVLFSPTFSGSPAAVDDFKSSLRDYDDAGTTPHARSFSVSSDNSQDAGTTPSANRQAEEMPSTSSFMRHRPLHLTLPSSTISSITPSPNRSPDSYLPTPDESVSSTDDELYKAIEESLSPHSRNSSFSGSQYTTRPSLAVNLAKKSLPELRPPAKLRTTEEFHRFPALAESPILNDFAPLSRRIHRSQEQIGEPSAPRRQDRSDSDPTFEIARPPRALSRESSISISPPAVDLPAPSMDVERNSYFRRYSTIQPSSLRNTIPEALLQLVDAVRGILFAVSQIYQTLQHYTVFAIDDRLSSILLKVLDPASVYMMQLINALDRFDSMSRRTMPTPAICRAVIESCRDNVAAFGKAVGVLSLQLKVLATSDDDRYTRQMLLVLYGASAEISNAWQSIVPNMAAVEPLLRDLRPPTNKKLSLSQASSPASSYHEPGPLMPPKPFFARSDRQPQEPSAQRHIARRHAGSFSTKDVMIGKTLPSFIGVPNLQGGIAITTETPTPRASLRHNGSAPTASSPVSSSHIVTSSKITPKDLTIHSRQTSQSSLLTSSTGSSSPSTPNRVAIVIPETPSSLNTMVDKGAIDAMAKAVEAAPPIWVKIESMLDEIGDGQDKLRDLLVKAQAVTARLNNNIENLRAGIEVDRRVIRETAHLFVKIVVHLSSELKTFGLSHPLSSVLRNNMVKLTNATEEFVILLHVSSFSSPRPYTPTTPLGGPYLHLSTTPREATTPRDELPRLGANLSRSRSAAAAQATERLTPTMPEAPRSALPLQTFKVSTPPRRKELFVGDALHP